MLGLEPSIDFQYFPPWTLGHYRKQPEFPVLPEVLALRGLPLLCVYGDKEPDSLCPALPEGLATIVREPGGHHFDGHYAEVADAILAMAGNR